MVADKSTESPEDALEAMESLLDQLISNAQKLAKKSHPVVSLEELYPLQRKQEELVAKLGNADELLTKALKGKGNEFQVEARARILQKLKEFQGLNSSFIESLATTRGLIQFQLEKKKNPGSKSP